MNWLKKLLGISDPETGPISTATLTKEAGNMYALRIGGKLSKSTVDHIQAVAAKDIERGAKDLKILVVLTDFLGWKGGADWGDINFFIQYESNISKIAVVGEARWEVETLAFLGAGRRTGQVKYFKTGQDVQARAWLVEA